MATITTREVGTSNVGRPLTNSEIDNNFLSLNSDITTILNTISSGTTNVPKITGITITDSSYNNTTANAIDLSGGYIKITGTGFTSGCQVLVNNTLATSVTFISSTQVRAQLPAQNAGSYIIYLVLSDGSVAIRVNAITYSSSPTWTSTSPIYTGNIVSIQLAATSDSTVTYSLASGSTLPTGITLTSSGLLNGTVTGLSVDTVYSFTITATDIEQQTSPKTFSVTIVVGDPYISYVPLLLETGSASSLNTTVTDSSASPNTVTRVSNPSTGWVSPYQADGYWGNYFNGSSQLSIANNAAFELGAGNFSYEAFVYATQATNTYTQGIITYGIAGNVGTSTCSMDISSTGFFSVAYAQGSAYTLADPTSFPLNQWVHCVACRSGSTLSIFVNGVRKATTTTSATVGTGGSMVVGGQYYANESFRQLQKGYISNARVLKGVSAYDATLSNLTVPTSPLTAITNTVLLTCQSNRFIDNSTNNFTLSLGGTPQVNPYFYPSGFTAPAASPGAALFSGSSQYLKSTNAATAFQFGTGPFTVEGWLYQPARPARQYICGGVFSGPGFQLVIDSPGFFIYGGVTGIGNLTAATITVPANAWTHFAIVRTSTSTNGAAYYINGAPAGTLTISSDISGTASSINVGTSGDSSSEPYNGYIANFRAVKGTAVYTGAFTPPSGPLTQNGGTYPSLTNVVTGFTAANTSLLLNLADSNYNSATNGVQNNTFIDSSNYAFPITRNGTPTQGSITPYWPAGQWSNYFSSGNYINAASNAAFGMGTGDFTIEAWIFATAAFSGYQAIFGDGFTTSSLFFGNTTGGFGLRAGNVADILVTTAPTINQWVHVACTRSGTTVRLFYNGVQQATTTSATSFATQTAYIGNDGGGSAFVGYISNLRLVKGAAVYTTTPFTPSTTPLTAITNTSLLTCQSNRFIDNSTNNFTITRTGSPTVQAFQPFSPTASYTTALYGGSGYFNGSTDYLTAAYNSSFVFGTNDFTVECWIYLTSNPTLRAILSLGYGANGSGPVTSTWQLRYYGSEGSNQIGFNRYDGVTDTSYLTSGAPIVTNSWYHIVASRTGGTLKIFVNGVSYYSAANTFNFTAISTSEPLQIGLSYYGPQSGMGGPRYFPGYISNIRIINGTGVYSSNFTPPTAPVTAIANTSLLLNMTNAAIYDAAAQNDVITVGNAQANTTPTPQFGVATAIKFNGSTDYITAPSIPALNGAFTIEFWFYRVGTGSNYCFTIGDALNATGLEVYIGTSGTILNLWSNNAARITSSTTPTASAWNYIAITRDTSNVIRLYLGGSQVGSTYTSSAAFGTILRLGAEYYNSAITGYCNGSIQDFRITNGVARTISVPNLTFPTR